MSLYLGDSKIKIILGDIVYNSNLFLSNPATDGIILLSSDNHILKDSNNLFITAKEDE